MNYEVTDRVKSHQLHRSDMQDIRVFALELQTHVAWCDLSEQLEVRFPDGLTAGNNNWKLQQKLLLLPDPVRQRMRKVYEQHQFVNNLVESNSQVLMSSRPFVYPKDHPKTL